MRKVTMSSAHIRRALWSLALVMGTHRAGPQKDWLQNQLQKLPKCGEIGAQEFLEAVGARLHSFQAVSEVMACTQGITHVDLLASAGTISSFHMA
jgi:hypothetical protein